LKNGTTATVVMPGIGLPTLTGTVQHPEQRAAPSSSAMHRMNPYRTWRARRGRQSGSDSDRRESMDAPLPADWKTIHQFFYRHRRAIRFSRYDRYNWNLTAEQIISHRWTRMNTDT
jgi:hypothetical protein